MKIKIKTGNIIFLGYSIYLLSNIFIESEIHNLTGMDILLRLFKYIGILICVFSCYKISKIRKTTSITFFILLFLTLVNMVFIQGGSGLIEILIVVLCITLQKMDISLVFWQCIKVLLFGHIFVLALSAFGFIKDEVSSRVVGNYMGVFFAGEYTRHQMGFLSSNQIPLTVMIIYIMLIVYKQNNVRLYEHAIFLVVDFWCFFNFGSRVSFLLIILAMCLYCFIFIFGKNQKKQVRHPLLWTSFVVCGAITVISACLYNSSSKTWFVVNEIFYNRLKWNNAVYNRFGFSLLGYGKRIGMATGSKGENIIDNGYMLLLMQKGIIISILIIALWCFITYKSEKTGNRYLTLALVLIAIASLIDPHLLSYKMIPFYCVFTLDAYQFSVVRKCNVNGRRLCNYE